MTSQRKIKWGIIGIGKIAHKFASDLQSVPNAELVAVASTSIERANDFAEKFKVAYRYGAYEAIFKTPNLDVVYIATTHNTHAENTILCLQNKVAVLCEKPLAINSKQVERMISAAKEHDTFLMEAVWTRFLPAFKKLISLIFEENAIGKIKSIHADFGFIAPYIPDKRIYNPALGGGALLDIGIYPAYLCLALLGYPTDIQASSIFSDTGIDVATDFVLKYNNDASCILSSTFAAQTRTEAFIYGEDGYIHLHPRFFETKKLSLYKNNEVEPIHFDFERETWGYCFEAEAVGEYLLANKKESDLMPLAMSQQLIQLLDAIREKSGIKYAEDGIA